MAKIIITEDEITTAGRTDEIMLLLLSGLLRLERDFLRKKRPKAAKALRATLERALKKMIQ